MSSSARRAERSTDDQWAAVPLTAETAPIDDVAAMKRILAVWRPHAPRLFVGLLLSVLAVLAGLAMMSSAGLRLAGAVLGAVVVTTAALRLVGGGRVLLRYSERLYAHDAMFRALATLRVWFFRSLASGAGAGLGFRRAGDLLSRLVSDVEALDGLYLRLLLPLAGACISLPVLLIALARANGLLAALVGALFVIAAFLAPALAARLSRESGDGLLRALAALRIDALDLIGGMREIRAFGAGGRMLERVQEANDTLVGRQTRLAARMALVGGVSQLCTQLAVLFLLAAVVGAGFVRIPAVEGVGLLFLTLTAFEGVAGLTRAGMLAGAMGAAASRVVSAAGVSTVEASSATSGETSSPTRLPTRFDIRFEAIDFRWASNRAPVFEEFSLDIAEGSRVALLGASGAGKSTLSALLLKAVRPQGGRVLLGGVDIATIPDEWLRRRVAWLSQATHLFDDTIRSNLLLSNPDAPEAALWRALDDAAIGDFVRALPEGLDTWLGEGGVKVSGGQGRRIALARTLLADAPILVLDEPTTGLDATVEQEFLTTLNTVAAHRTVLLIAHRLTGVEELDRVWRISGGEATAATA
ncbi:transport ATP-binding protein CydD [Acetobacter nitrogenifigens DSM 23921 = NBRC 105050]|uniref:Thiol reductant ABC exporter subunit CydC n=2 Tax=Acetobacter nitrogenifigens TaxID=285268 RepID=A0A511X8H0_9PROT|nr:transport ATP-binding protein CydD [Acetobacter nitrogenifigens DSM 23921 = NBRC 105050]GEN59221.1 thiol reductant ABC exporter subunit CydC [Acetobacter nitrogenifigens DSM 23921 = NBRC 105050]